MNDWSEKDVGLLLGALSGVYKDTESTKRAIARGSEESNPLLGKNPSGADLDKFGIAAALLGTGTAAALPEKWRRPMLGAWAGLEHGLAKYNDEYNAKKGGGKFEDAAKSALPLAALGGLLGHYLSDEDSGISVGEKDGAISLIFKRGF